MIDMMQVIIQMFKDYCFKSAVGIFSFFSSTNVEIWKWWQTQKFQKEQGEQEYIMIYEIDLPKILKAFVERFPNCV